MQTTRFDRQLSDDVVPWLTAFKRDVVLAFPGVVEAVILFGSRARGESHPASDYDVAVLLSGHLADDPATRRRVSDIAWQYQGEDGIIQAVPLSAQAFQPPRTELALRIAAEGVLVR